ncbi:MAG: tetratricopeptide repeat protein [Thermoplasmata archaeon]|nr:tetratricopeptide repeat protein [Thermoplasmata archaeon]
MSRIATEREKAAKGESQFICIKGEAGSGKTRLVEEAAAEAGRQGFSIGFGTALAESVIPFHAWTEVLRGFDLAHLLDEAPPPTLLGLYLITAGGEVAIRIERKGEDRLGDAVSTLVELVRGPESNSEGVVEEGELSVLGEGSRKFVVHSKQDFHLGAILDGREDEIFLSDLRELADAIQSTSGESGFGQDFQTATEASMQQLLDSEKYEGIDYAKENPKLRQSRLFENITLGLARKADVQPICVVVDDLQWADPSTLALLHYVIRNTRKEGVFPLGTCRVEAEGLRPHLKDMLREVEEEDLLSVMNLEGLSKKDMPFLAESFLGPHDLPETFLDNLWQETQGYPLFIREVFRGLEEDDAIQTRGAFKRLVRPLEQLGLPEMVREVIQARLNRLPKEERRLLDAAATCGTRFTAALVAKVTGEEEGNVLNGLKAIMEVHGLLRPMGDDFAFDHPTVQETLYQEVPHEIRRTYHRQAAEWLELTGGPAEDVAEHYYRARDPRAAQRLRKVAGLARGKYANDEAIRFYQEALEFEEDTPDRMRTFEGLGRIYELIGNYGRSIESYNSALELAKGKKRAEITAKIGNIYKEEGEYDKSIRICTRALDLVKGEKCKEEALALNTIGNVHLNIGEYDRALEYYERSLEIRKRIGDQQGIAASLNNIGIVHYNKGEYDRSLEHYHKSLEIREKIGDQWGIAASLNNIGNVHYDRGEYDRALEYHERSLEIRKRIGDQGGIAASFNNIGGVHYNRGEYDRALEYHERSLAISEKIGRQQGIAISLDNIGDVHLKIGEYDRALEYHERSLAISEKIGDQQGFASSLDGIGLVHFRRSDYDKALEYFENSLEIAEKIGDLSARLPAYTAIAEVYIHTRDLEKALDFCNLALSLSTETGRKRDIAASKKILGMICRERKMWQEALVNFEAGLRIFKEMGQKFEEAMSHLEFGLMWKAKGDLNQAKEHLNKALGIFDKLKLEKRKDDVKAALETLGEKPIRPREER